ncbi:hypothetical protein VTN00DRAFT_6249 [Thermoascus crustaceus]|uniref:uncharacterized protein n=1 Tax=Thermoascus crustaceus TaxID=5088 RepID=UPI003742AD44
MPVRPNTKFRRAISPAPTPSSRSTRSQFLTFQAQSPLLAKIPPEIRRMIWEAAIGGQVVHIVRKKKKKLRHKIHRLPSFIWDFKESDLYGKDDVVGEWSMVSLLRTSRQVYNETVDLLYETNTFHVEHPWTFIFLYETLLPQRWQLIRELELTWTFMHCWHESLASQLYHSDYTPHDINTWNVVCAMIKRMTSLRSFVLTLNINWCDEDADAGLVVSDGLASAVGLGGLLEPLKELSFPDGRGRPWMIQIPIWCLNAEVPVDCEGIERKLRSEGFNCTVTFPGPQDVIKSIVGK